MFILFFTAISYCESIGRIRRLHLFWSRYLRPIHHCSHLLQSDVWILLTSLILKSESAAASGSTISSARKPLNPFSLSESSNRPVSKTGNVFLRLDFKILSHFCFEHKDDVNGAGGSSRSLVLLLFTRFSWDCTEISLFGSSEVYWSWPDVLGFSAHGPALMFSDVAPGKGLKWEKGRKCKQVVGIFH